MIFQKDPCKIFLHFLLVKSLGKGFEPHVFCHFLEENLAENPAGRGCGFKRELYYLENSPVYGICVEDMSKEICNISQPICLIPMYCRVFLTEKLEKMLLINLVYSTESLG